MLFRIDREPIKRILRRLHLIHPIRYTYRKLSLSIRRDSAQSVEFYRPFVHQGSLCFDLGAHLGDKTEIFLKLGGRVIAVEPNPMCLETLRWRYGKNSKVTIVPKAISDQPGTATLHFGRSAAMASLREDWSDGKREAPPVEVTIDTIDALIEQFGVPDFIKIDVEGLETKVIGGLSRSIPCICFEYFHRELDNARNCLDRLASLGRIECNATTMDWMHWIYPDWCDGPTLVERLAAKSDLVGGDIFVRFLPDA